MIQEYSLLDLTFKKSWLKWRLHQFYDILSTLITKIFYRFEENFKIYFFIIFVAQIIFKKLQKVMNEKKKLFYANRMRNEERTLDIMYARCRVTFVMTLPSTISKPNTNRAINFSNKFQVACMSFCNVCKGWGWISFCKVLKHFSKFDMGFQTVRHFKSYYM